MANGFYGNISNVSKTQMQIDKIYPSRKKMDENANTDSVALGRYVLVEYGAKYPSYFHLYEKHLYSGYPLPHLEASITKSIKPGDKVVILPSYKEGDKIFYHIWENKNGELKPGDDNLAGVYEVKSDYSVDESTIGDDGVYNSNYNDDRDTYGNVRGYDSTVWMKVLKDGVCLYEHVADLNTVIPTFITSVDAPKEDQALNIPYALERNDMLYDLHTHPAPKFRIKDSEGKSDDAINNKNIYFNKAGFNQAKQLEVNDVEDVIKVEWTGVSGEKYSDGENAVDTHELSILLPSIGNTISKVWDLVYKPDGEGNRDTTIQSDSLFNGENYDMSTIAGCIRTAQDVLGQDMIKEDLPADDQYANEYDNAYIYKQDGKYYIIVKKYSPVYSDTNELIAWNEDGYELKEINLNEPVNSIFGAMAQMNQELNVVEEKIGAYYKHLNDAVDHLDNFKTITLLSAMDREGGAEATAIFEAEGFEDSLALHAMDPLYFHSSVFDQDKENSISLDIHISKELVDDDYIPISSKAVKTEVDNITSLIGDIGKILNYVNTGVKPESL